jgi:hypothetical protein
MLEELFVLHRWGGQAQAIEPSPTIMPDEPNSFSPQVSPHFNKPQKNLKPTSYLEMSWQKR